MWVGDRSKNGRPHGVSCHKYIQYVNDGVLEVPQGPRKGSFETSEHMKGMIIFVIHSCGETLVGMTDSVYELVNELYRHGATLLSKFDHTNPTATHIVCLSNDLKKALHQLKISKITNLPPGIPTLNKEWMRRVTKGQGEGRWSDYAAFPQRKNVPQPNADEEKSANKEKPLSLKERQELARAKARARYGAQKRDTSAVELSSEGVDSEDEEQTRMDRGEVRLQALQFSSPVKQLLKKERRESRGESSVVKQPLVDDPLAAFYTKARVAALQTIGRHGETEEDDAFDSEVEDSVASSEGKGKQKASSWTVDQKPTGTTTKCANHDIIEKLEILMKLHESKPTQDDKWRAYSYSKAIRALKAYPTRIASLKEAQAIYGIGEKTGKKIMEIIETGDLRRIAHETTEDVLVTRIFTGIYGVGSATAYQWYMQGYRTLEDVQKHKKRIGLSRAQEIGLANYDDINTRMPREEAGELFELIKPVALRFDNRLDVQIMGSYRRGKSTCGDIDIMITRDTSDGRTHAGALRYLLKALHDKGIITDDLATPDNSDDEECIYRGLCRLPHREGSRKRRIDFLCIPWISRGAALIYYTGDDIFNRAMRWKANKMGYSLNQRGLWTDVVRDPRNRQKKLSQGTILASSTEEEIFKILEVPWQEPYERVRNLE
ncbi:hypothetical protein DL96DRAFT_814297 [Flagelloscypha sp. PMI_526]|nr:hypothetical protein DL96DRAFT_814297 [Flagelloscypha sp. PMI_526]